MHAQYRGWRKAALDHLGVGLLDVLGQDLVQPPLADARDQMYADDAAVALEGPGPDACERDVVDPVVQPVLDADRAASSLHQPSVPFGLQLADLPYDVGTRDGRDVSTIALAVALDPHRDVAVPAAVRPFDYRGAPRRAASCRHAESSRRCSR